MNSFAALGAETFDLLVIGAGSTGAGVALDAALRGLRVALVDKGDFASGTSSASSKLIHGGLRYLEHGQFRLVYEALRERRLLLRTAPHLVRPLEFVLPFYRGGRLPHWQGSVGLFLYDFLAGSTRRERARRISATGLRRAYPSLRASGLTAGMIYVDALMDDARLGLSIVLTAQRAGAVVQNYAEVVGFETSGGHLSAAHLRDSLTGATTICRARCILNAAGPWVDRINALAGIPTAPWIQPTKGVHLIVRGTPFVCDGPPSSRERAFLLLHPADGRVFFVIPWQRQTLIGTTDTFTTENPDELTVGTEDEAYLLAGYNHYFRPSLTTTDVAGRFVGLRPLLKADAKDPSARSREFRLRTEANGLIVVAGGKWTTWRHMAEVVTDEICRTLGRGERCRTARILLHGTPREAWARFVPRSFARLTRDYRLDAESALHLINRYGAEAEAVAKLLCALPNGTQRVRVGEPDLLGEEVYQRRWEMARTQADVRLRRSRIGMWHPDLPTKAIED